MQPLNLEHYDSIRTMAAEIHAYAPDARVLTTYYCGMHFPAFCHIIVISLYEEVLISISVLCRAK